MSLVKQGVKVFYQNLIFFRKGSSFHYIFTVFNFIPLSQLSYCSRVKGQNQTSRGIGYSSDSSMRTTWLIFGLLSESGSTHLKAVKSARLRALVDGLVSMFGSTTSSERLSWTIILSHSTRLTYRNHQQNFVKAFVIVELLIQEVQLWGR